MQKKLTFIIRYLSFLRKAKSRFGVHSPFLYDLITKVIRDKSLYSDYLPIEELKKHLLASTDIIEVSDYGAGSRVAREGLRHVSQITASSSKSQKFGRLLYRLSRFLKPDHTLELGTSMGLSTAYLARGNPDSNIITIEGCPNIAEIAGENFKRLNIRNIRLVNGQFDDVLPDLLNDIPQINMAFIDGNHRFEPTVRYFEQCKAKAVNGTCFVFDDIHWSVDMEKAWEVIKQDKSVSLTIDLFFMGIVFIDSGLSKEDYTIRF